MESGDFKEISRNCTAMAIAPIISETSAQSWCVEIAEIIVEILELRCLRQDFCGDRLEHHCS
ncbi:MAG: hypothetical protein BJG00_000105 [Limnothrix sp. CACIAM 69d]|nr:MAG: hypothetical protein BJG00_000105 [Limnothrix sp. CACIAM 69d]